MNIVLTVHSWLRWLVLLVAVVATIKFPVGWLSNSIFQGMDRGRMAGFSGLMDIQVTLGPLILVSTGISTLPRGLSPS